MCKIRNFHKGRSTVGKWQGNGMVCVDRCLTRQGNGMVCVNRPYLRPEHLSCLTLQHDCATAHSTFQTREWLQLFQWQVVDRPPCSP
jgi:hypothetical protein